MVVLAVLHGGGGVLSGWQCTGLMVQESCHDIIKRSLCSW
jgi:hypothetical protein